MRALVLDAGALVAVERDDRAVHARLKAALQHGLDLRTTGIILAQVWRDRRGRQARLSRILTAVDVRPVDEQLGREAGILIGLADTSDPMDATIVLVSDTGDIVLTSDPLDISHLAAAAGREIRIVEC